MINAQKEKHEKEDGNKTCICFSLVSRNNRTFYTGQKKFYNYATVLTVSLKTFPPPHNFPTYNILSEKNRFTFYQIISPSFHFILCIQR
jgi:hypothetical protein